MPATAWVGLLRGVNVGGRTSLSMADLRSAAERLGWAQVSTYIRSGNLLFRAAGEAPALERELEAELERVCGSSYPVVVRDSATWLRYVDENPFRAEAKTEPTRVQLCLAKAPPPSGAVAKIEARGADGERVVQVRDALWIHYPAGVGRSKITPVLLDRAVGTPVTARGWKTVVKLGELVQTLEGGE